MYPPCIVFSLTRADGWPATYTVAAPVTMTSSGPLQVALPVARAWSKPFTKILSL